MQKTNKLFVSNVSKICGLYYFDYFEQQGKTLENVKWQFAWICSENSFFITFFFEDRKIFWTKSKAIKT